jgi:NitT/TauT family transport system substrate-binding protein
MQRYVIVMLAGVLLGCHGPRSGSGVPTIRIAVHRDPIAFLPVRVAETLGFYRQEGVAVELSDVAGGTKAIEALLGGSVDVAVGSMSDVVALAGRGRQIRGFFVLYTRPTAALAVAPALSGSIRTVRDLKGHTVGVTAAGSATHQILNFLLVKNGLSPDDVSTLAVGMSAGSVAALEHGKVDAAVLLASAIFMYEHRQPATRLIADTRTPAGAREVFGSETFPSLSLLAPDRWLQENPDTARRLVRALARGLRWVHDQPAERVRDMIPPEARMPVPDADLEAIRAAQSAMSPDGLMPAGAAELIERFVAVSDARVRAARLDPARTYTNEFAAPK